MERMILLDVADGLATVTLHRPERRNAMTLEMADQLLDALCRVADDRNVDVVVLTGAGPSFCVGADLAQLDGRDAVPDTLAGRIADVRRVVRTAQLLHDMPAITIAAINGACAGGGLSWAAACDLRVAADDAVFNTAFLGVGVPGDYGVTWTLSHLLGAARARELLLLSEKFTAADALRFGLVSKLFPADELTDATMAIARSLLDRSPTALRAMKRNLVDADRLSFHEALETETERMMECIGGDDMVEATRAFREKRRPRFAAR